MRIARFGANRTPQAKLFDTVLEDLQGRSFTLITELGLFHHVQRGEATIRTIGTDRTGLHFGIRRLSARKKLELENAVGHEVDFMLVAMEVVPYQFSVPVLNELTLYRAEQDLFEVPVLERDVVLISRRIIQEFLKRDGTVAEPEIVAELKAAYAELQRPSVSDWE